MRALLLLIVTVAATAAGAWVHAGRPLVTLGPLMVGGPALERPTVVLAVLDTVRADHLAACGYERPVGWFLVRMVEDGAALSCDARTPGSWTLPSHASFFTGLQVVEHGAHPVGDGLDLEHTSEHVRALAGHTTLAERLRERGYQTIAVVENPVISEASGLLRGFDVVVRGEDWGELEEENGSYLAVRRLLGALDEDRPLFLFLNLAGAHQPWLAIEDEAPPFLPRRPALRLHASREGSPWRRYLRGEMPEEEAGEFLAHLVDVYDYGVWREVRTLRRAWRLLERRGWARSGRLVVTSDHGEFLGEEGLLDHGHYLDDANTRVPLLYWDSEGEQELPSPVSAAAAYSLALDGELPEEELRVESVAWPHPERCAWSGGLRFGSRSAAIWDEAGRTLWKDGEVEGPRVDEVTALAEAAALSGRGEGTTAMLEVLRSAGYVE